MLRLIAVFVFVLFFSARAWKSWFPSLCAAIILMAVIEHPDMPKTIGGIPGLNPWNLLMANVTLAWWAERKRSGRTWDLPRSLQTHLIIFLLLILAGFLRLLASPGIVGQEEGPIYITTEYLVNCFKWLLPAVMVFDYCRTERRVHIALGVVIFLYLLLAIQVIRWMPLSYAMAGGADMARRASKIVENEVGYNRVTLSMILGGASWAILSSLVLVQGWKKRWSLLGVALLVMIGQALTGGRTGYASWFLVGVILCVLRWRKYLLLIPVIGIVVVTALPGVRDRLLFGVGGQQGNVVMANDDYEMTSGRTLIWPFVIEKIKQAPILGYGRRAMINTGLRDYLMETFNEGFPHPHNAYLEVLLDNGIVGFVIVIPLLFRLLFRSFRTFLCNEPTSIAIGGACCAMIMALLIGSMGGQTFYPREGAVGMWVLIGLLCRVCVSQQEWTKTRINQPAQVEGHN